MWYFKNPYLVFGEGALDFLEQLPIKKVFIVTDKVMVQLGFVAKLEKILKKIPYKIFDEVEPDPSLETVQKGAKLCQEFEPNYIIAIGGGSIMDAGKGIFFLYHYPDQTLESINPFMPYEELHTKAKYITIPTTSGTGADVSWAAVLTDTSQNRKITTPSRQLVPDYAIIDPAFPTEMPPALTASTGADALVHAIEAFTSRWRNDFSDAYVIKSIEFIFKYLPRAYHKGEDPEAREKMHNAASMAGLAFGNSQVGFVHSIGHTIGAVMHKQHGLCVGMALPYVMEFTSNNEESAVKQLADIGRRALLLTGSDKEVCKAFISKVRDLLKEINIPSKIPELGVSKAEFEKNLSTLIQYTNEDSSISMTVPMPDLQQIEKMYQYMWEGKRVDF